MTYNQHYREEYHDWELDQHPAVMLQQMERQIREGKSFVNIFVWSSRWKEYLSKGGRVSDNNCESLWIFRRGIVNSKFQCGTVSELSIRFSQYLEKTIAQSAMQTT